MALSEAGPGENSRQARSCWSAGARADMASDVAPSLAIGRQIQASVGCCPLVMPGGALQDLPARRCKWWKTPDTRNLHLNV